ncbi:MAG: hypothetical protein WC601_08750 [Desulfotomaculaceae bacterium]
MKKFNLFFLPSRNIALTIPLILTVGFIAGLFYFKGSLPHGLSG